MHVKSILHETKYIPISIILDGDDIKTSKSGSQNACDERIKCPRCDKSEMYLGKNGDEYFAFCADYDCLQINSEINKAERLQEFSKRHEEKNGMVITGAMKFRMGQQFHNASLNKWIGNHQEKNVAKWINDDRPFLISMGIPGTGKTYMSAAILNYLTDSKKEVHYVTHSTYNQAIHSAIQENQPQHTAIDKIAYKDYLIFDDLGSTTCTEWQKEMLLDLVDRRYASNKKTVFTTNLRREDLSKTLGIRTASRLLDNRNCVIENWSDDRRSNPEYNS